MAVQGRHATPEVWRDLVPPDELALFEERGFGGLQDPGERVLLLVVDVVESFMGPRPGQDADSVPAYGTACGPIAWERLPTIVGLIDGARAAGVPVAYSKGDPNTKRFCGGSIKLTGESQTARHVHSAGFPDEIRPRDDEFVLEKTKASAFFGTPLLPYLVRERIDTLLVAGTATSGCVRATVVDAASSNLKVFVVEDACFDRSRFAHAANLLDMHMKYADVITSEEAHGLFFDAGTA
jgi:nicotinamidase-related amidase